MRKLFNGTMVPTEIKTDERIFKVETFDSETVLCNLDTAYQIVKDGYCMTLKHLWDYKFKSFGKLELIEMYKATKGLKTYLIEYEKNERVNKSHTFSVEAIDRNEAVRKALEFENPNTRLMRIYLDGIQLFMDNTKR